jgi:hypothetical protein
MDFAFAILVGLAMLGALGALGLGVINMARGGDPRRSNRLMRSRVAFQFAAVLLFALLLLLFKH